MTELYGCYVVELEPTTVEIFGTIPSPATSNVIVICSFLP